MSANDGKSHPPNTCPYCGESVTKLPTHLPCEAVPPTEGVE